MVTLQVRDIAIAGSTNGYETERDNQYVKQTRSLDPRSTILVVIDAWQTHPNDGLAERLTTLVKDKINPLIQRCRQLGIRVIHTPHGQPENQLLSQSSRDYYPNWATQYATTEAFDFYLKNSVLFPNRVRTLIYCGAATNWCVTFGRPIGLGTMAVKLGLSRSYLIVRDACIAVEMPCTLDAQTLHDSTISMVEMLFGASTTVQDLQEAN